MADVAEKPTETPAAEKSAQEEPQKTVEKEVSEETNGKPAVESTESTENGKSDEEKDSPDKLTSQIIRQIEYYFGDANLVRDKFLKEQITANEGGWVPISVLTTFKRLAQLTTDPKVIVDAMNKSDEGLVEVSEDGAKLRRHPERPVPERGELLKEVQARSVYVKGFPLDSEISQLIEFFDGFKKVQNVTMRKYFEKESKTYKFKGSVFVSFETVEQAEEFVNKAKVLYKERELIRKFQAKYHEEKREEHRQKIEKKKKKQAVKEQEEKKFEFPRESVIAFDDGVEGLTRELLREAVEKVEGEFDVAYVDYEKDGQKGFIRFSKEKTAAPFLEACADKKLKINDKIEINLRLVSGEEEDAYLDKAREYMKNRRAQSKRMGGNRKRHGGGNYRDLKKKRTA